MKKIIVILLVLIANLSAQDKILTLEESIKIGIANSKELKIAGSKMASSEAKITEAGSQLLPQLKLQATYQRLSDIPPFEVSLPIFPQPIQISPVILDNYNVKLSLQQPLFTGFRLSSIKDAAESNHKAVSHEYQKEINETAFRIQNAFWNYYKAEQIKQLIIENLDATAKHLEDTKNFLKNGLATNSDILKLQVLFSNTRLQLIDAENNVDIARSNLNKQLGLALEADTKINPGIIDTSFTKYQLDELIRQAQENRDDLKSVEYRVHAGEKGITAANAGWYPSVFLFGDFYYSKPNQRIIPAENKFRDTWDVGVSLQWDLWNWGYVSSQSVQAEEQKLQIETSLSQLKDAVELEVYQSFLTYNRSLDKIKVSVLNIEQAEDNYRTSKEKYDQQLATSTDLIDAEVSLLQAETNMTNSLVDFQLAKVKLLKAIGLKIY
ncbi:MAG: TolC family protein [Ignavibacteriaceae bacterium]